MAHLVENPPASARDAGSVPGSERSPGEGNGNPLPCSCLENPMDRGARWATVHGFTKSQTRLTEYVCMRVHTHTHIHTHTYFCLLQKISCWQFENAPQLLQTLIFLPGVSSNQLQDRHLSRHGLEGEAAAAGPRVPLPACSGLQPRSS